MLKTHDVHRRAVQFELQRLTYQRHIQPTHAMLMGAEAAVFMVVIMLRGRISQGEWKQGEGQSEQQTAHKTDSGHDWAKIVM
jgi:hypothetical protein